ncbi:FtsX-like permease family protein [Muriicola jejuensis]|uniref:FtsX-like permease family protein n=2 Tax=Muriicola jejuensis TaxID=504488 RepID=A0A6P0UK22_9FLAO|nr:FtsX-like permease family protein [Muriicola jejuensis]NER11403.1 FtsX-like permease family protein [Muriicola jejuensis]
MAWRDLRSNAGKLFLFMSSIIIGIAALVAIQSFGNNLTESIDLQSRALMGADYVIDSNQPANEEVIRIMDSLGGPDSREINFASMVVFPKSGNSKLVQVVGTEKGFPFYGEFETEPADASSSYLDRGAALVDATVMLQQDLKPGDSLKVGNITLPIAGALKAVPGRSALSSSVAPAVFIPYEQITQTGLVQRGSRVEYKYYFVADQGQDLEALYEAIDPRLDAEGADLDTHLDESRRLGRRYNNFGKFLNIVAFIALLLGCVGIGSAVHVYIRGKLRSIAVLKCMGASRSQTFKIFLIQVAGLGAVGGIIGTLAGISLQMAAPALLEEYLPVKVSVSISYPAIILGLLLGVLMSVFFALLPLLRTWYVSPLSVLRVQPENDAHTGKAQAVVLGLIFLFLVLLALQILGNWQYAFFFILGLGVSFALLYGVARILMWAVKRYFPEKLGFCVRQSMLNLFRPQNQTSVLLLSVGVGAFLISTLFFSRDILLSKVALGNDENSPNIILLDVQTDQVEAIKKTLRENQVPVLSNVPIVTMRVEEINGRAVNEIRNDTTSNIGRWVLNHEFRVTYRDSLIPSESVLSGAWVGNAEDKELVPISVAENFASDARVEVGDRVTFNVQGVMIATEIASIREVDWGRVQLNFSVLFPNGVLEDAPKFHVVSTRTVGDQSSAVLQRQLVSLYPNVSIIDLRQILSLLEGILNKIGLVIRFMALLSILTGIVVLVGAVRTSKYQRIRESVLLRTLGAKNAQLLRISFYEYAFLGILGSLTGILLSLVGSFFLARFVFEEPFVPSTEPFLILLPILTLIVVCIGLLNSRSVLNTPPLEILRSESR